MTNYNGRLDEILSMYKASLAYEYVEPMHEHLGPIDFGDAKQAITSLIKELVEEAKPETLADPDDTDDLMRWQGYVDGVIDFEQNLLKALESKSE